MNQTIELTDDDTKEAVILYLNKKLGLPDDTKWTVHVGTETTSEGMGMNEHDVEVVAISATRKL